MREGTLYRSAAPNYTGRDDSQNMNEAAINFLVELGVSSVISANEIQLNEAQQSNLRDRGINYLWLYS